MKKKLQHLLQKFLGFENYLFLFSLYQIKRLKRNQDDPFNHFMNMIPEGGVVLDIGANIGIMSVNLSRKHPVYAFEPIPENLKALKRVVRYFTIKNIRIFEFALGNSEGTISMVMPVLDKVKMQGLSHVKMEDNGEEGEYFTIPVKVLDNLPEIQKIEKPITAIKIDVENFEYFVLDGARNLLKKYKPLILTELWDNEYRQKCFDLLEEFGYHPEVLEHNRLVPFNPADHQTSDFFFRSPNEMNEGKKMEGEVKISYE